MTEAFDAARGLRLEPGARRSAIYGFLDAGAARAELLGGGIEPADFRPEPLSLEDIFIALTGKY